MNIVDWFRSKINEFREMRRLADCGREELCNRISDLKEKATLGDQDATITLKNVKATVDQQTKNLHHKSGDTTRKHLVIPTIIVILALALAGCVTKSTHTEGDREVNDQTLKAGEVVQGNIVAAIAKIDDGKPLEAKSLLEIGALAGADVVANMQQQLEVHGPPEKSEPYSAAASEAARQRSTESHENNTLDVILAVGSAAAGIAATMAGMPWLSSLFPALTGKIGKWAKAGSDIITAVRTKAEAQGGSIDVRDILEISKEKNVTAGIQKIVTKYVDKKEEELGKKFIMKLEEDPEPEPTPPAPPPVTTTTTG